MSNPTSPTSERERPTNSDLAIDSFIKKWCGENAAHLLDTDDNDGEYLRRTINRLVADAQRSLLDKVEAARPADMQYQKLKDCLWCGDYQYRCSCSDGYNAALNDFAAALAQLRKEIGGE